VNLDANAPVIPADTAFDAANPDSYTHALPINVYDSLGNTHQLTQYFVKRAGTAGTSSNWDVYFRLNGARLNENDTAVRMNFDPSGRMTAPATAVALSIANISRANSPALPLNFGINYGGSTQFAGDFTYRFTQDGYATGEYASMSISADGSIVASYTNGETQVLGTLALAHFANLQGLKPAGGNAWMETAESGQPVLGQPGSNGMSTINYCATHLPGQRPDDQNAGSGIADPDQYALSRSSWTGSSIPPQPAPPARWSSSQSSATTWQTFPRQAFASRLPPIAPYPCKARPACLHACLP
jgi:flagellar hook-basal body protein